MVENSTPKRSVFRRFVVVFFPALIFLCLAAAGITALSNRNLPAGQEMNDLLLPLEIATIQEAAHLKAVLGESIWPGWGQAEIPTLIFNDAFAFLLDYPDPPTGWDAADGSSGLYRRQLSQLPEEPQNFALQVGEQWVTSFTGREGGKAYLMNGINELLPEAAQAIFPYKLLFRFMLPTDQYIAALLHESFHAYQATVAPERFEAALAVYAHEPQYWQADAGMHEDWDAEVALLVQAVEADSDQEAADLARQFLAQRARRRESHQLAPELVMLERQIEWLEGTAMYIEFSSWRAGAQSADYQPLASLDDDPDFHDYDGFQSHWSRQLAEMKRQATGDHEIRFYFNGMAQGMLLDRLMPDWKTRVWEEDVWLERLLAEAVGG